ncbi:restriction endonuclease [Bacillus sp. S3]|uniref:restriction endonuclease n=1 Tax=Bacillus sp. S3 TaxID=486398 RepID=UPI00118C17F0|nr:restriction endonuclease [Bacillus sp. S3]QCJ40827.1 restriction endonuclease [Bacillus sp. S3]
MVTSIVIFLILLNGALILYFKKREEKGTALLAQKIDSSLELKKTLAMGLYLRFNYPTTKKEDGITYFEESTDLFLKQVPYDFEEFAAQVFQKLYGGEVFVTNRSGDFGVDFEQKREDGLYLGQAKAWKKDVGYEPIAILHSNMVKQNAKGGYLITTAQFTKAAKQYASDLNIQLIDGVDFVEYWLDSLDSKVYSLASDLV